jgi:hypothetical protein
MKFKRVMPVVAAIIAVGTMSLSPAVFAQSGDDEVKLWMMLRDNSDKARMISKERFMKLMESRWAMMDKEKKGMMSADKVRKLVELDFMHAQ